MSAWLLAGLALSVPFTGKPTHLTCVFTDAARTPPIAVTIARSHRAVTLTIPSTGHVENQRASLSGATISFDSPLQYGNVNYAIDRSDLSIVRTSGGPAVTATAVTGQCRLEATPKLIF